MHKNIKTVAGCFTNVTCNVTATDGREVELTAYIAIGQERRAVPKAGANLFAFPAVEYGQHLYEIRADGKPLIFGFLLVRPSAFPVAGGTVDYTLNATLSSIDALHVDIELAPGPRGYSAYEVAVREGFVGSEPEWLEYMRQQTATLAVEQVTPLMERAEAAAEDARDHAENAETFMNTASSKAEIAGGYAEAAQASKDAAAAEVDKVAAEVDKATQEKQAAGEYADAAAKSANDAAAEREQAEKARQDAQAFREDLEQAATDADAAKMEAQTAERNAKASATQAAADKTAAEQAKTDAQAAQVKAEQEADKAEQNAALLGDAALKGGDNTFTGGNTFAGDVYGVLPADFWAYTWCSTKEELYAACPDLLKKEMCCIAIGELKMNSSEYLLPSNIKKAVIYFVGETPDGPLGTGLTDVTVIAPNAIQNTWCITGHVSRDISWKVIMPKRVCSASFGNWCKTRSAFLIAKNEVFENNLFAGPYGNSRNTMEELVAPLNVVKTVSLSNYKVLKNVPVGFPHATSINLNSAVLNKESVLAILSALQPYDSSTMSAVPDVTLGVDPALEGDEEINAALLNAQEAVENGGKGWNVAVSGFTITAGTGAATMGLRRLVYVKREPNADGGYIAADGQRWNVRWGNTVLANWRANEELGFEAWPSVEAALEEWGLRELTPEEVMAEME